MAKKKRTSSRVISPPPLAAGETVATVIEKSFLAYNSRRLQDACRLFVEKVARPKTRVALAISGALTPAGLGASCIVPLMEQGWVDWIVSTGANLYHDLHVTLGFPPEKGPRDADDARLLLQLPDGRQNIPISESNSLPNRLPRRLANRKIPLKLV